MPNIGFPELVVLLVIVLLLFGPKKLPDFAKSMGQAIREFRRASQEVVDDIRKAADETPAASESDRNAAYAQTAASEVERPAAEPSQKQL
ncbi:MAG TPA: twin-arginine translocase TatA/TatE family subunit [Armatimonadota bacterium]|nr:twin-arginine translocase TatA/TatE family subunit [Armatimonadota bacterium]HOM83769.1 twin-arginine translocase TatA/TatE family subunit [Armatimonadota bacterium]HOQ27748.1 twin-arginine translocase TatA/TatE family subunit [Armatimonadota bacterium]HPT97264.1 twin-arginine translocase TatA/TatE family subunit [Armatimonadota bacterium]